MKFYKDIDYNFISNNSLTAIYSCPYYITFFKNGLKHNDKNAAHINFHYKNFYLNDKIYYDDEENKFNKESWRRFVKLQAFL